VHGLHSGKRREGKGCVPGGCSSPAKGPTKRAAAPGMKPRERERGGGGERRSVGAI